MIEFPLHKITSHGSRHHELNVEVDFHDKGGKPLILTILAGVNGSGKTRVLNVIYEKHIANHPVFLNESSNSNEEITKVIKKYIDKVIYEKGLNKDDAIKDINDKIFSLIPNFGIKIAEFSVGDSFRVIFKNKFNAKFLIYKLASGELSLLNTVFRLYLNEIKNRIILIDEPENSLHPSWQSKVVQLYENYAKQNNCQIIMATHSPFILSAVKSEQIRLLKRTPEGIKIEKIAEEINGWTIERILQYFMETEHVRDPKTDKEIAALFEMMKSGDIKNGSFKERFAALEERLGYVDNDMASLRMELNRLQKNENN